MADQGDVVIEAFGVAKNYQGLRPLRVHHLEVREGETLALLGFDQAAAEAFVNLITAATLPDVGEVRAFGRRTSSIEDAATWLDSLDRFGIVSERAVVLDNMTVLDNLTMPVTMSLHDVPEHVRSTILTLADEVGLGGALIGQAVASLGPLDRQRLRLGRALAPGPRVLLAEHPNAVLPVEADRVAFAADYVRLVAARRLTSIVLTADPAFASAVATRVLTLQPATGELKGRSGWRRWFG